MTPSIPSLPPGSPPLPEPSRFTASDGYEHAYRLWSVPNPRAIVIALHGIQSHAGWYGWSSSRLSGAGYVVAFLDRRGSGVNAAGRGDAPHAERLVHDVVQFAAHLDRRGFGGLPKVLTAISWGGKLAASAAVPRPDLFAGLALITPGLCTKIRANAFQRVALRLADVTGARHRSVAIPLRDPALFTDIKPFQAFISDDPLTLREVTVRFLAVGLALDRYLRTPGMALRLPTLLLLAGRDRIVDNAATTRLVRSLARQELTVRESPSARHTLEFEPDRDEFVRELRDWIERTTRT